MLAGQQGEDEVLQECRDPVSHWLPKLCAHICYLSSWTRILGSFPELLAVPGGGGGSCLPVCVCVQEGVLSGCV